MVDVVVGVVAMSNDDFVILSGLSLSDCKSLSSKLT